MPPARHDPSPPRQSFLLPAGGRHLWASGQTSKAHTHRRGHLVYAASGVLAVHTDLGTSVVPANRVSWMPSGVRHQDTTHGHTDMRIVFLPTSLGRLLPDRPAVFLASGLAREVLLALTGPQAESGGTGRTSRLQRVLVDELGEASEHRLRLPTPQDDRLRAVARRLSVSPGDNSSLETIGRTVGASARTLSRLLRTEFGMTYYEWRTQVRVYRALVLLGEGHDITHTAHACGWSNPSSFIDAFTKILGVTPGQYRSDPR